MKPFFVVSKVNLYILFIIQMMRWWCLKIVRPMPWPCCTARPIRDEIDALLNKVLWSCWGLGITKIPVATSFLCWHKLSLIMNGPDCTAFIEPDLFMTPVIDQAIHVIMHGTIHNYTWWYTTSVLVLFISIKDTVNIQ